MSIYLGYSHLDEKLQGNLADALRKLNPTYKSKFIRALADLDIDFSRSINKAVKVKNGKDPRLQSDQYVAIGVYSKPDGTKGMVAYQPTVGPVLELKNETLLDRDGKEVTIKAFGPLSWAKWLKLMTDVYIIDRGQATSLADTRKAKEQRKYDRNHKDGLDLTAIGTKKIMKIISDEQHSGGDLTPSKIPGGFRITAREGEALDRVADSKDVKISDIKPIQVDSLGKYTIYSKKTYYDMLLLVARRLQVMNSDDVK